MKTKILLFVLVVLLTSACTNFQKRTCPTYMKKEVKTANQKV